MATLISVVFLAATIQVSPFSASERLACQIGKLGGSPSHGATVLLLTQGPTSTDNQATVGSGAPVALGIKRAQDRYTKLGMTGYFSFPDGMTSYRAMLAEIDEYGPKRVTDHKLGGVRLSGIMLDFFSFH